MFIILSAAKNWKKNIIEATIIIKVSVQNDDGGLMHRSAAPADWRSNVFDSARSVPYFPAAAKMRETISSAVSRIFMAFLLH